MDIYISKKYSQPSKQNHDVKCGIGYQEDQQCSIDDGEIE